MAAYQEASMEPAHIDFGSRSSDAASIADLGNVFAGQRAAFLRDGMPTAECASIESTGRSRCSSIAGDKACQV
jgi:hypothetical protein